jgi:hypothetical protein
MSGNFDDLPTVGEDFCIAAPKIVHNVDGVEVSPQEQCMECAKLLTSNDVYVARHEHESYGVGIGDKFCEGEGVAPCPDNAAKVCVLDIQKDMNPGNNPETIVVTEQV